MDSSLLPGISVVIPVYNSAQTIGELVHRLVNTLRKVTEQFEIILVNDGSRDDSWRVIDEQAQAFPAVRGINLMRNYGQHNALLCGIRAARYDSLVTIDDDLQHPPEEIPVLVAKLSEGYDVVYGVPRQLPHAWWRNLFSRLTKRMLTTIMGARRFRDVSAFRVFHTTLRQAFASYQNPNVVIDVLLSWGTTRFGSVVVDEKPRQAGSSGYNFARLFQYTLIIVTGFSTTPLRLASLLGFTFTLVGLGIFIYVITTFFLLGSVPGFPFLASMIAIFSGVQLFTLGIFGEYLARIFDRSMDRPPYVIGETTLPSDKNLTS